MALEFLGSLSVAELEEFEANLCGPKPGSEDTHEEKFRGYLLRNG